MDESGASVTWETQFEMELRTGERHGGAGLGCTERKRRRQHGGKTLGEAPKLGVRRMIHLGIPGGNDSALRVSVQGMLSLTGQNAARGDAHQGTTWIVRSCLAVAGKAPSSRRRARAGHNLEFRERRERVTPRMSAPGKPTGRVCLPDGQWQPWLRPPVSPTC
jgi:hypothetical protein